MLQKPQAKIPYLFIYSPEQETGKSSFHEALNVLFAKQKGYVQINKTIKSNFDGELENAILCVLEEVNLSGKNSEIYDKIKDYTTSSHIAIRPLYRQQYLIPNYLHFIQCANKLSYLPIEPGDTRIVVVRVHPIEEDEIISREELHQRLKKEAPDFLAEILSLDIPQTNEPRMELPVLTTIEKVRAIKNKQDLVNLFIEEECFFWPGKQVSQKDFMKKFNEYCDANNMPRQDKKRAFAHISQEIYPIGRGSQSIAAIGNLSFNSPQNLNGNLKKYITPVDNPKVIRLEK